MKLIIDIPEKTNAHIRSDYGHGVVGFRYDDEGILCHAVYHGTPYEERPHGEWIDEGVYADYVGQHVYKCTYCNDRIIEFPTELGSYCKYCGSDNRKKGDAE